MSKVLIFCPTYRQNIETLLAINGLTHDDTVDFFFSRDNPYRGDQQNKNILHQFKKAQTLAAQGGYTHILTIEDDMIPPADAIINMFDAMARTGAGVVYGVYHFRRLSLVGNVTEKNTGASIDAKTWRGAYKKRATIESGGLGWGCTLIKAEIFCSTDLITRNDSGTDSDTNFSIYCRKNGIKQVADFRVLCGHKRSDGIVLYPSEDANKPRMTGEIKNQTVKVKALMAFGGLIRKDTHAVIFEGETGEIDSDLANVLVSAGQAAYV